MKTRSTGLWAGGSRKYLKALREEEDEKIAPLRKALESETDPRIKRSLKDQIKAIKTEFKEKRKAAASGLFMKP